MFGTLLFGQKGKLIGNFCQPMIFKSWSRLGRDLLGTQRKQLACPVFTFSGSHITYLRLDFSFLFSEFAHYNEENISEIFWCYLGIL